MILSLISVKKKDPLGTKFHIGGIDFALVSLFIQTFYYLIQTTDFRLQAKYKRVNMTHKEEEQNLCNHCRLP